MKLADIDFSKYRKIRNRLVLGKGEYCFIGACAKELGLEVDAHSIKDSEGKNRSVEDVLASFSELENYPDMTALAARIIVMNDGSEMTLSEIQGEILYGTEYQSEYCT